MTRRFRPDYAENFARYYQDELRYLKELGAEFAKGDPGRVHFEFDAVDDPDVKCLLEGFSFLTARIRQNLDDELPELSHSLLELLYPHYLRSVPAFSILQFTPKAGAVQSLVRIPAGAEVRGKVLDGTVPRFTTTAPVELLPIQLEDVRLERGESRRGALRLVFSPAGKVDLAKVDLSKVRLYLTGEEEDARLLLWLLLTQVDRARVRWRTEAEPDQWQSDVLPASDALRPVGFGAGEPGEERSNLVPHPPRSFSGYRLLHEYFAYPRKYHFVDLCLAHAARARGGEARSVLAGQKGVIALEILLEMDDVPAKLPQIHTGLFRLFCTPVVNLFEHDSDPLVVDHTQSEYLVRPQGRDRRHYEVWSVEHAQVIGAGAREVPHFFQFHSSTTAPGGGSAFYETRLRPSTLVFLEDGAGEASGSSTDTFIRFVTSSYDPFTDYHNEELPLQQRLPAGERISLGLLCTNRHLSQRMTPADLSEAGPGIPSGVEFRGIEPITRAVPPPLGHLVHWRLLSHLSLNFLSLASVDGLRGILEIYDYLAQADNQALRRSRRRLQGIKKVTSSLSEKLLRGAPVRVVKTDIDLDEEGFMGLGDMYLFGSVLEHFLAQYVAANCLSQLTLRVPATGMQFAYPARGGGEVLL